MTFGSRLYPIRRSRIRRDAIIKVSSTAICGPIFTSAGAPSNNEERRCQHETMGEVAEVGSESVRLKVGDRIVVLFSISRGDYFFCRRG